MKSQYVAFLATLVASAAPANAAISTAHVAERIPLHDGGWDILTVDPVGHQLLVSRADGVDAIDTRTGAVKPRLITGTRFHGVTVVPGGPLALASQAGGSVIVFNRLTGKVAGGIKTDPDADATIYEPTTHAVWVMDGDSGTISLIDPSRVTIIGKINVGGSLEFPALDGRGHLFVNVEDKGELVEISIAKRTVMRRIPLAGCEKPTGLTYVTPGVLISACANGVAKITRASDGKAIGDVAIGPRPDGAFADPVRHRAYIPSGGDGTLTVIETGAKMPRKIGSVSTEVGARTGAVDATTGVVYLIGAKFGPTPQNGGRPPLIPGSVELLVVR
jgi:DNA-binding beta-propeller fold protein YncE